MIKWKNARDGKFIASLNIITPSWLNVERAMIFFKSNSFVALRAAINIVREEVNKRIKENSGIVLYKFLNRMSKKTPAVTKVDEWTRAETGVGAAIAAGSQLENGNWALLVIAASRIEIESIILNLDSQIEKINQLFIFIIHAIDTRRRPSPNRLVKAVIIPALKDLGFW